MNKFSKNLALLATIAILPLSACSGSGTAGSSLPTTPQSTTTLVQSHLLQNQHLMQPNCTPTVWASSLSGKTVTGYAGGAPCVTIDGSTSGTPFYAPFGLATDSNGYLYVADVNNNRIVVFDQTGAYYSTLNGAAGEQPVAVCVSQAGVVGVANRPNGGTASVTFYTNKGVQNGSMNPTGSATGVVGTFTFCAFDKSGDFFSSGRVTPSGAGNYIVYVRQNNVNVPNAAVLRCNIAACTSAQSFWVGMYSHIRAGNTKVLSVGDAAQLHVKNFVVTPSNQAGHLNFAVWGANPTTALTGYPASSDPMYQLAPTTGQNNASTLYIADYGTGQVLQASNVNAGGPVTQFNALSATVGVATNPTGQY